jgi:hypothetical protein
MDYINGVKPGARASFGEYKPLLMTHIGRKKTTEVLERAAPTMDADGFMTKRSWDRGNLYPTLDEAIAAAIMPCMLRAMQIRFNDAMRAAGPEERRAMSAKASAILRAAAQTHTS